MNGSVPMARERLLRFQNPSTRRRARNPFERSSDFLRLSDLEIATDVMELLNGGASSAISEGEFVKATASFKEALDICIDLLGNGARQCAPAYYKYGLALLYEVPTLEDDPMQLLLKEADYLEEFTERGSFDAVAKQYRVKCVVRGTIPSNSEVASKLKQAWEQVNLAWSIEKPRPDSSLKANILCALGEIAFRKGELNPQEYYLQAINIMEGLVRRDNLRIAEINVKICICIEGSNRSEARKYFQKAISLYRAHVKQLLAEIKSLSSSSGNDSAIDEKEGEVITVAEHTGALLSKGGNISHQPAAQGDQTVVTGSDMMRTRNRIRRSTQRRKMLNKD